MGEGSTSYSRDERAERGERDRGDGRRRRDENDDEDRDRERRHRRQRASPSGRENDAERESVKDWQKYRENDRHADSSNARKHNGDERRDSRRRSRSRSPKRSEDRQRDARDAGHRDSYRDRNDRRDRDDRSYRRRDDDDRRKSDYGRRDERDGRRNHESNHGLPPLQMDPPENEAPVKQFVPPTKESILADRAKAAGTGTGTKKKRVVPLIEVIANDRLGGKGGLRVKCSPKDTIGDLKKLIAAQKGTKPEKIVLKKWYNIYKDHVTLEDYGRR